MSAAKASPTKYTQTFLKFEQMTEEEKQGMLWANKFSPNIALVADVVCSVRGRRKRQEQ